MTKRNILSIFCALFINFILINVGSAATLKAVLVIVDDYEDAESNNISASTKVDLGTVSRLLTTLDKRKIVKVEKKVIRGRSATLKNVNSAIDALSAGKDDIVLFYFSGHGGMENNKTFMVTSDGKFLFRDDLKSRINSKQARLKIIISDACSNDIDGIMVARSFKSRKPAKEGKFDEIYRELFLKHKGLLHISSSTEGQYAWSDNNIGGFFTYYFFNDGLIKSPLTSWKELFDKAHKKTVRMYNLMPAEQRSELAKEGVNSQSPKAFSLPSRVGTSQVNIPAPDTNVSISIKNMTSETVSVIVDQNLLDGEWDEGKLKDMELKPGKTLTLKKTSVLYFDNGEDTVFFEVEQGKYELDKDEDNLMTLYFEDDDEISNQKGGNKKFHELLVGEWDWDDGEEPFTYTFKKNNTCIPEDGPKGEWEMVSETIENEKFDLLVIREQEGSDSLEMVFIFEFIDDDTLQLELADLLINGEPVEGEEEFELELIMLYRN